MKMKYIIYLIGAIIVLSSNSNILVKNTSMNREQARRHAILNITAVIMGIITISSFVWIKDLSPFVSFSSYYVGITVIISMHLYLLYKHIYLHEPQVNTNSIITLIAAGFIIYGWINNCIISAPSTK